MVARFLCVVLVCVGLALACQTGASDPGGRTIDQCATACWKIGYSDCGDIGEECVDRCVRTDIPPPEQCPVEQQQYADCFWQAPAYVCHSTLGTVATGCDEALAAALSCLGLTDAGSSSSSGSSSPD